jgi:hypothetical protein
VLEWCQNCTVVQRRVSHEVSGVAVRVLLEQKLHHVLIATLACAHQPGVAIDVTAICQCTLFRVIRLESDTNGVEGDGNGVRE